MPWSPVHEIRGSKTRLLQGVKVVLCVTGSVAAYKSVDLARELIRNGAEVVPVLSRRALEFVGEKLLHWATGVEPVVELSGRLEHVELAGDVPGSANLVLVAPATATTISRIANGDASTTVTAIASVALGSKKPVVIAPAMHEQLYNNPVIRECLRRLESLGVYIVRPELQEGKAKMASVTEIVENVVKALRRKSLANRKVLITTGPTIEYIDPIRVLSNKSSGKMGAAIAYEAVARGAEVVVVAGYNVRVEMPREARVVRVETSSEMLNEVLKLVEEWGPEWLLSAAAISDFRPEKSFSDKLPSGGSVTINLVPTEKVVDRVAELGVKVFAFRAVYGVKKDDDLVASGREYLRDHPGVSCVAVNDVSVRGMGFSSDYNRYALVSRRRYLVTPPAHKRVLATYILDFLESESGE